MSRNRIDLSQRRKDAKFNSTNYLCELGGFARKFLAIKCKKIIKGTEREQTIYHKYTIINLQSSMTAAPVSFAALIHKTISQLTPEDNFDTMPLNMY